MFNRGFRHCRLLAAVLCLSLLPVTGIRAADKSFLEYRENEGNSGDSGDSEDPGDKGDSEGNGNSYRPGGTDDEGFSFKPKEEEPEPEPESNDPIRSACIVEIDDVTYILDDYGSRGFQLWPIPFSNAEYDYVSSFAYYNGKVYYCCKDAGTSDYHMALYETDVKGSKHKKLYEAEDLGRGCVNTFVIKNNALYVNDSPVLERDWKKISLKDYSVSDVDDIPGDVETLLEADYGSYYCEGKRYYVDGQTVRVEKDGSSEKVFSDNDGSIMHMEAVIGTSSGNVYIYYSMYHDSDNTFKLYRYDTGTAGFELIGSKQAAGGGGYFNW